MWEIEINSDSSDKSRLIAEHVEIAKSREEAEELFRIYYKKNPANYSDETIERHLGSIRQDEDVVDTWFSSWLWPISVFDGFKDPDNADINYYYPTSDLVTAPEILFFWVARMIMAGHEFRDKVPFRNVYLTGIVRDKQGRKMSKSLGNSPDPIELIEKYGADGVRVGMLLCSPAGNDLMFDESYCEQGRNFANKVWNAFRLVKGWEVDPNLSNSNQQAIRWFSSAFNKSLLEIEDNYKQYRLSEALMGIYKLVWDDFCAWYLEMIKPVYQQPIDQETYRMTVGYFEDILKLLHPLMPFLTEELWHDDLFAKRTEMECCIVAPYPVAGDIDTKLVNDIDIIKQVISEIRNIRNTKQISPKEPLNLKIKVNSEIKYKDYFTIVSRLANVTESEFVKEPVTGAGTFMAGKDEFFVPLENNIDPVAEKLRIEKEIEYLNGFLRAVESKLSNQRFVQNAKPEVVEIERQKKEDALSKLKILEAGLKR
jgi:valyl-tRNA synthetase